jgi:hypothetical protein
VLDAPPVDRQQPIEGVVGVFCDECAGRRLRTQELELALKRSGQWTVAVLLGTGIGFSQLLIGPVLPIVAGIVAAAAVFIPMSRVVAAGLVLGIGAGELIIYMPSLLFGCGGGETGLREVAGEIEAMCVGSPDPRFVYGGFAGSILTAVGGVLSVSVLYSTLSRTGLARLVALLWLPVAIGAMITILLIGYVIAAASISLSLGLLLNPHSRPVLRGSLLLAIALAVIYSLLTIALVVDGQGQFAAIGALIIAILIILAAASMLASRASREPSGLRIADSGQ